MRRGWLVVALLLSLGVNLGLIGAAFARRSTFDRWREGDRRFAGRHEPLSDRPGAGIARHLGLDRTRSERFVETHRRMAERTFEARREIGRVRAELRRRVGARTPDRAEIDTLLAQLATAESALNRAVVDGILEARAALEPDEARAYLRMLERVGPPGAGFEHRGFRDRGEPPFAESIDGEHRPRHEDPPLEPEPPPEP